MDLEVGSNTEAIHLPNGLEKLETQVAGHMFSPGTHTLGMLKDKSEGYVLKPLGKPQCGERELNFYQQLNHNENMNDLLKKIRPFIPKFHGIVEYEVSGSRHTFIKLEDLTYNMRKPCIMDVKVGRHTWDPFATQEKRLLEEQKYKCCKESLGLCLPGFQMYTKNTDGRETLLRYGREYGKQLDREGFCRTVELFLHCDDPAYRIMHQELLRQLYSIHNWFKSQSTFHFYASSLLIVYDSDAHYSQDVAHKCGDKGKCKIANSILIDPPSYNKVSSVKTAKDKLDNKFNGLLSSTHKNNIYRRQLSRHLNLKTEDTLRRNPTDCSIKVRMIDFAHVFPASSIQDDSSHDKNYMFGLENLIHILERSSLKWNTSHVLMKNIQNYEEYKEFDEDVDGMESTIIQCQTYLRDH